VSDRIDITIAGEPAPQPRAKGRLAGPRHAPFVQIYTPDDASIWKGRVYRAAKPVLPVKPWTEAVRVSITLWIGRPGYLLEPKAPAPAIPCPVHGSGDVDNFAKAIMDVLTHKAAKVGEDGRVVSEEHRGLWKDDSQVVDLRVLKFYHAKGCGPGARIVAEHLVQEEESIFAATSAERTTA